MQQQRQVLQHLEKAGEATRTDFARVLGFDPVNPPRCLETLLQAMRRANLIKAEGRGIWRLADGIHVCPECHGRGVLSRPGNG